jgi:hypothetical protein
MVYNSELRTQNLELRTQNSIQKLKINFPDSFNKFNACVPQRNVL